MSTSNRAKRPSIWILIGSMAFVLSVWGLSWLLISHLIEPDDQGPFGDQFGAVNALFSGLAFAVLIYTMRLQSTELALQREELESTREVLIGQETQLRDQTALLRKQRIEDTFFKALDLLRATKDVSSVIGFDREIRKSFEEHERGDIPDMTLEKHIRIRTVQLAHETYPFFRTVRHLESLVRLTQQDAIAVEKAFYQNLILIQFEPREIVCLAVYVISQTQIRYTADRSTYLADEDFRDLLGLHLQTKPFEAWKLVLADLLSAEGENPDTESSNVFPFPPSE